MGARKLAILAVSIGVAGVVATACTDHPNRDLNEQYSPAPAPRATHSKQAPSRAPRPVHELRRDVLLTATDLRHEGVGKTRAPRGGRSSACITAAAERGGSEPAAAWRYPTGSKLYQYVFRGRLPAPNCGTPLRGVVDPGSEHSTAWCTHTGCGVAFAERGVVSAVWVATPRRTNAADAVRRLAPVVSERLSQG